MFSDEVISSFLNDYKELGLEPFAPIEKIKNAYRRLFPAFSAQGDHEKMVALNAAKERLLSPEAEHERERKREDDAKRLPVPWDELWAFKASSPEKAPRSYPTARSGLSDGEKFVLALLVGAVVGGAVGYSVGRSAT